MLKFDYRLCQYALKNNLHVEFFIWVYLRSLNSTGFHCTSNLDMDLFCKSTIKRKLKDNIFFKLSKDKILLTSSKNLSNISGVKYKKISIDLFKKFPKKYSNKRKRVHTVWDSTTIKYFLISVIACRYEGKKPYALCLISQDTGCSISTIQRAINNLFVTKFHRHQEEATPRSYQYKSQRVNLTPNFMQFTNLGDNK